jgi:hypothetical protein
LYQKAIAVEPQKLSGQIKSVAVIDKMQPRIKILYKKFVLKIKKSVAAHSSH